MGTPSDDAMVARAQSRFTRAGQFGPDVRAATCTTAVLRSFGVITTIEIAGGDHRQTARRSGQRDRTGRLPKQ